MRTKRPCCGAVEPPRQVEAVAGNRDHLLGQHCAVDATAVIARRLRARKRGKYTERPLLRGDRVPSRAKSRIKMALGLPGVGLCADELRRAANRLSVDGGGV